MEDQIYNQTNILLKCIFIQHNFFRTHGAVILVTFIFSHFYCFLFLTFLLNICDTALLCSYAVYGLFFYGTQIDSHRLSVRTVLTFKLFILNRKTKNYYHVATKTHARLIAP